MFWTADRGSCGVSFSESRRSCRRRTYSAGPSSLIDDVPERQWRAHRFARLPFFEAPRPLCFFRLIPDTNAVELIVFRTRFE